MPTSRVYIALLFFLLCIAWSLSAFAQDPTLSRKGRFEVDHIKGCAPLTVNIEALHYTGTETVSYAINGENGRIKDFGSEQTFVLPEPGTYRIVQNITGLDDPEERKDSILIEVLEPIVPEIEVSNCGNGIVVVKAFQEQYDYYIVDGNPSLRLEASNNFERSVPYDPAGMHQVTVQGMYEGQGVFNNCGEASMEVIVREDLTPAASITEVRANVQEKTITLHYNLLENVQYLLEIQRNDSGNFVSLGAPEGNEFTLTDRDSRTNFYCFRIRTINPCDPSHTQASYYSNTVCTARLTGQAKDGGNEIEFETKEAPGNDITLLKDNEEVALFDGTSPFLDREVSCNTTYTYSVQINSGNSVSITEGLAIRTILNGALPKPENIASNWKNNSPNFKILLPFPPQEAQYLLFFADDEDELVSSSEENELRGINQEVNSCYILQYADACENISTRSESICALYIQNVATEPDGLQLEWNEYTGYQNGVSQYVLEEYNPQGNLEQSTSVGLRTSIDLGEQPLDKSGYSYRIKAIPVDPELEESTSNTYVFQIVMEPFFPNAFNPNGQSPNNVFTALGKFVESGTIEIFNRWGAPVFKTSDLKGGWNGSINGDSAPQGTYYYKAEITTIDGSQHSRQGTVFLMKK